MYFVYLLESIPTGRYYIGQTANLNDRITRHNNAYEKATKHFLPWKLIASIQVETRKEAMALEKKIKSLKKRELQLKTFVQMSLGSEK